MKTRGDITNAAFAAWQAHNCYAAEILGTGTGKSKLGIEAVEYSEPTTVLILVNSERLRDVEWRLEFIKWGAEEWWPRVEIECYHTAYRWKDRHWDLVIADEGDYALTEEYSKFFFNNTFKKLLFLTATVTDEKQKILDKICPVAFRYTTQQAQEEGILNKTKWVFVEWDLDTRKNIPVKYKKEGKEAVFYTSENDQYLYWDNQFKSLIIEMGPVGKRKWTAELLGDDVEAEKASKELDALFKKSQYIASKRKDVLYKSKTSVLVTRNLLGKILSENPKNKVLVFSKRTDQIDSICVHTYHSKNKKDNDTLEKLSSGVYRSAGVVDAANRGVNLSGVNNIIKETYHGSSTDFQQQHGRGTRLDPTDVMTFYILVPHYHRKVVTPDPSNPVKNLVTWVRKPTQAWKWAMEMTKDFDLSSAITITDKEL